MARPPPRRETGTAKSRTSDRSRSTVNQPRPGSAAPRTESVQRTTSSGHSPGRRTVSDRQGLREASGTGTNLAPIKGRSGTKTRGLGLRAKFMLVLSLTTAIALALLGIILSATSSKYLFSQKQHDGIEVAMHAAELASAVADQLKIFDTLHGSDESTPLIKDQRLKIVGNLKTYLAHAISWGKEDDASDILAVQFDHTDTIPEMNAVGTGPAEQGSTEIEHHFDELFLPKNRETFPLPDTIKVEEGRKLIDSGWVTIYRFELALDPQRFGSNANVRVDVDARGVDNVRSNLVITIVIVVLLATIAAILVANYLAGNITRPVQILLKDMQVVARGDLGHQTKAHSQDEIGILANEFNRMTGNLKEAQVALVEQEKAEYELSIAREVQKQLLPAEPPLITGFECADYYKGAKAVSGDYYDFIPLGNALWGFIVADVSGKGIPGSMVMAVTRTIVRLIAVRHQNRAADTLKETNRLIAKQIKRGMFVTSFYAVLDERTGTLTYASAGHNPMIIYRAQTRSCELATGKGIALGFNEGPIFDKTIEEHRTVLQPHDSIVLYTDGFPEAMDARNQEFGDDRFYQLVAQFGHLDSRALIEKLVAAIAGHRGDAEQSDDLTLITVRRA